MRVLKDDFRESAGFASDVQPVLSRRYPQPSEQLLRPQCGAQRRGKPLETFAMQSTRGIAAIRRKFQPSLPSMQQRREPTVAGEDPSRACRIEPKRCVCTFRPGCRWENRTRSKNTGAAAGWTGNTTAFPHRKRSRNLYARPPCWLRMTIRSACGSGRNDSSRRPWAGRVSRTAPCRTSKHQ